MYIIKYNYDVNVHSDDNENDSFILHKTTLVGTVATREDAEKYIKQYSDPCVYCHEDNVGPLYNGELTYEEIKDLNIISCLI